MNRQVGTGYNTNESWIDGYRKWKDNLDEKEKRTNKNSIHGK